MSAKMGCGEARAEIVHKVDFVFCDGVISENEGNLTGRTSFFEVHGDERCGVLG